MNGGLTEGTFDLGPKKMAWGRGELVKITKHE